MQIKDLEKQLAESQKRTAATSCPTGSNRAAACNSTDPSSTAASPENVSSSGPRAGGGSCTDGNSNGLGNSATGEHAAAAAGTNYTTSYKRSGSTGRSRQGKQLPWWQHMVLTGLSVVGVMGYMSWEASWYCAAANASYSAS